MRFLNYYVDIFVRQAKCICPIVLWSSTCQRACIQIWGGCHRPPASAGVSSRRRGPRSPRSTPWLRLWRLKAGTLLPENLKSIFNMFKYTMWDNVFLPNKNLFSKMLANLSFASLIYSGALRLWGLLAELMVNSLKSNAQAIHETHPTQCNSKQFNATHTNYVTNISQ